jgi:hypothetical protein
MIHSRSSVCKEPSRIFVALVGGQAPEVVRMDEICRFARLKLSGCHPDLASNVFGRGWVEFSDPSALLATRFGANLTIPGGLETP